MLNFYVTWSKFYLDYIRIFIGIIIIDVCDKWSKKTQEKYRRGVADQLKEYEARIETLAEKVHNNNVQILVLEAEIKALKQSQATQNKSSSK